MALEAQDHEMCVNVVLLPMWMCYWWDGDAQSSLRMSLTEYSSNSIKSPLGTHQ